MAVFKLLVCYCVCFWFNMLSKVDNIKYMWTFCCRVWWCMGRVIFEYEKNGKQSYGSSGFVRTVDASDVSLHSSLSKDSDETCTSRKGLHKNWLHSVSLCLAKTLMFFVGMFSIIRIYFEQKKAWKYVYDVKLHGKLNSHSVSYRASCYASQ